MRPGGRRRADPADRGRARGPGRQPGPDQPPDGCTRPGTCSRCCGSTVFSPDDLAIVKAGPAFRRRFLDDASWPTQTRSSTRCAPRSSRSCGSATRSCGQAGGRLDRRCRHHPRRLGRRSWPRPARSWPASRRSLLDAIVPRGRSAYDADWSVTGARRSTCATRPTWEQGDLGRGPGGRRDDELRRGVTLVGPTSRRARDAARPACRLGPTPPRASNGPWRWRCRLGGAPAP